MIGTRLAAGAITSWRYIADDGLRQALVQLLRYLHDGVGPDQWAALTGALDPSVRGKLQEMCA